MIRGKNKHIDVDLSKVPSGYGSGLLELPDDQMLARTSHLQTFSEVKPGLMIPRSEWVERAARSAKAYRDDVQEIKDQGNEGACVGAASAQMLETTLRRRYGKRHWVPLSGMSIYKRIGRSAQSGAIIPDGMDAVIEGVLPLDTLANKARYSHTHPFTGWSKPLPDGWAQTAQQFRGQRFAIAKGTDEIVSALLNGYVGIVGRQGHAIPYIYADFSNGKPVAAYANSWGEWGDGGFGYDSEAILRNIACYILVDVVTRLELEIPVLGD